MTAEAQHEIALWMAQSEHRPHSLMRSQRFWQPVAYGPGVVAWGYAYAGGRWKRAGTPQEWLFEGCDTLVSCKTGNQ